MSIDSKGIDVPWKMKEASALWAGLSKHTIATSTIPLLNAFTDLSSAYKEEEKKAIIQQGKGEWVVWHVGKAKRGKVGGMGVSYQQRVKLDDFDVVSIIKLSEKVRSYIY